MATDASTDVSGILGKLGIGAPGGGILGGKIADQPLIPQPDTPAAAAPPAIADAADLQRVFQRIHDNAAMLMALGGGMMTGGVGHGVEAAAKVAEGDHKQQAATASRDATLRALMAAGVPPAIAQAAASNPTVLKAIAGRTFAPAQSATPQPGTPQAAQTPQPPQTMKVRLAGGGDTVVTWDAGLQQYVQVPPPADK